MTVDLRLSFFIAAQKDVLGEIDYFCYHYEIISYHKSQYLPQHSRCSWQNIKSLCLRDGGVYERDAVLLV